MSEVPTLQQEVDRKALEALEMIATDRHLGKITEAQYSYALTVLWASCAGIAGSDFTIMMEVAQDARKDGSFYTREFYRNEKGDIAKVTNYHDGRVRVELSMHDGLHKSEKMHDMREEPGCIALAKTKFQTLCDNLIAKGFNEI